MKSHWNLNDQEFSQQFAACTLDPALFSHEAHLRLAWILLSQNELRRASALLCQQIKNFDQHFGDGSKFHRTLTEAAVRAVYHFKQKSQSDNVRDFLNEFPRLGSHFKEIIAQHYGFDLFSHSEARHRYIEPDLVPFT